MDKWFHPPLCRAYDYLCVLGLKLISERGPRWQAITELVTNQLMIFPWGGFSFYTRMQHAVKWLMLDIQALEWLHIWLLKSRTIRLFFQRLMQSNNKKTSKTCITGLLWGESIADQWIPLTKGHVVIRKAFPCHEDIMKFKICARRIENIREPNT